MRFGTRGAVAEKLQQMWQKRWRIAEPAATMGAARRASRHRASRLPHPTARSDRMPVRPWNPELGRPSGGTAAGTAAGIAFGLAELYERMHDLDRAADWYRRAAEAG